MPPTKPVKITRNKYLIASLDGSIFDYLTTALQIYISALVAHSLVLYIYLYVYLVSPLFLEALGILDWSLLERKLGQKGIKVQLRG